MKSIADKITISQDKGGMLRRALERIIQLYTDKSHFVYELLQNAEDAGAKHIKFVQYEDRLEVLHDGKPFTTDNLQGLCDIGLSDKVNNLNQIGEFGVGFKSVFGICDTVRLYSNPSHYRNHDIGDAVPFSVEIRDFTTPVDIPAKTIEDAFTTYFVFPYAVGESFSGYKEQNKLVESLSKKLQNLGISTLLFMKNLEQIEYQVKIDAKNTKGKYLLDKKVLSNHCMLVSAMGKSNTATGKTDSGENISYLRFSRSISKNSQQTVDIAFPVIIGEDGSYNCISIQSQYVSVYFPTETESKLDFIVQGPYRTTPNRSSIPEDDYDNKKLAAETAQLLCDSIIELRDANKLNMSFIKALPLMKERFDNYKLFYPLYVSIKRLLETQKVLPCKVGGYVTATSARIARTEKLSSLLPDNLLTDLINCDKEYRWLPTFLTETNREYEQVYRFLVNVLNIRVIRPEDLGLLFSLNKKFLPKMGEEWLVKLYSILENVGAAFSKNKKENSLLTSPIVKTTRGDFVAPYRRMADNENQKYVLNVFVFSDKINSDDINFVDKALYEKCSSFFDNVLQIQKPNEYEFFIRDFKKRYGGEYKLDGEVHIKDVKLIIQYRNYAEYREEIEGIIKGLLVLKCSDGNMRNTLTSRIFLPKSPEGIDIKGYFQSIVQEVYYLDESYYLQNGISVEELIDFGVRASILIGEKTTRGVYDANTRGRQPEWHTSGDFRWKLSIESLLPALNYITEYPDENNSIIKSQMILKVLLDNESKLEGDVRIGGTTQNLMGENCEIVKILRKDKFSNWNGKWLYTSGMELVSQKGVSKYNLNTDIYGKIKPDSKVYELLGFKKTKDDMANEIQKNMSTEQIDYLFESELKKRFGITSEDLDERFFTNEEKDELLEENSDYIFPVVRVNNWESLNKHVAEMLFYANPVKYEYIVRSVRVSSNDAKAYLLNMYRYSGYHRYACQMCHEPCGSIEQVQLFNQPEAELDPMNLCMCPNCATNYRRQRNDNSLMETFKSRILKLDEKDVQNGEQVIIPLEDKEIWFTQTHFAEIQGLLQLSAKSKEANIMGEKGTSDLSYNEYVGKHIDTVSKSGGVVNNGIITRVEAAEDSLYADMFRNNKSQGNVKLSLKFVINNTHIYHIY